MAAGLGALLVLGGLLAGPGQTQEPVAVADLRVEWELDRDRKGNPILGGYVYNARAGAFAADVQIRITGTDRTARVVYDVTVRVYGDVPPGSRSYFGARIPTWDLAFNVTILSAEFRGYGGGAP